ncbi:tumor susceptibility gene 101 protein-like [Ruditapes philippinarum]|uniref:tumor susceptibility gene 101 protein-like n=1 Tax=Ruditapes philippinarum TaxID=129788 RepID=UPI00295BDD12|nr:tumor susceptibility gene 101 protein-like [Ruditapes philippinarum]
MSYDIFLNTSLAKYQNPGSTKTEVKEVMSVFQDLRPKLEETKNSRGETIFILVLDGTIPVLYKDETYNTPIAVWISDKHPNTAPTVYVKPSTSMYIRQIGYVDDEGRVYTKYMKQWNRNSTLLGLIIDLVEVFGQNPPLSSFAKAGSDDRSVFIGKLQLSNYMDPVKTKRDAITIIEVFTDMRGSFEEQAFADGTVKPILSLSGTIPVIIQDSIYNTPLCIYLMDQHPYQAPIVFVKPASNMAVNENCYYVDKTGLIKTPFLTEWNHPNSDLVGLLQDLTVKFGKMPPLWNTSVTKPHNLNTLHQTVPGAYGSASSNSYPDNGSVPGRQLQEANSNNGSVPGRPPLERNSNNSTLDDAGQVAGRRR